MRLLLWLAIGFLLYQLVKRMMSAVKSSSEKPGHVAGQNHQEEVTSERSRKKNPDLDYASVREARYRDLDDEQP